MTNMNYVTHGECEEFREDYKSELNNCNTRLMILESSFKDIKTLLNVIAGLVGSGMVSIIVILLTRGI